MLFLAPPPQLAALWSNTSLSLPTKACKLCVDVYLHNPLACLWSKLQCSRMLNAAEALMSRQTKCINRLFNVVCEGSTFVREYGLTGLVSHERSYCAPCAPVGFGRALLWRRQSRVCCCPRPPLKRPRPADLRTHRSPSLRVWQNLRGSGSSRIAASGSSWTRTP